MASPSRCKLHTKGNWKLPVELSSPSLRLAWESSPAGSTEHAALGSCPHLVDYKLPAEDKGRRHLPSAPREKCK